LDIAPSVAWKVNDWISIGAGLDEQYAHVKLDTALPNPLVPGGPTPGTDGRLTLRAHNWATGFNVGVLLKPAPGTKLGVSYRSGITHNFNGSVEFLGLAGPLAARNGTVGGSAPLDLPSIVTAGISQRITPRLTLMGEVDWYKWSNFKQIDITLADGSGSLNTPENYRDTWSVAAGGEYMLTDTVKLRMGLKWDETPTVNGFRDTRVPDGDRIWLAGGLGWKFSDHMSFDASYAHIFVKDSSVNLTRPFYATAPLPIPTVSNIAATSHVKIDILSVGVNYVF
jgi:long-chain fatty acid transport protein